MQRSDDSTSGPLQELALDGEGIRNYCDFAGQDEVQSQSWWRNLTQTGGSVYRV